MNVLYRFVCELRFSNNALNDDDLLVRNNEKFVRFSSI